MRRNGKEKWSGVEGQVSLEADTLNDRSRAAIALLRSADPDERQFDELEVNFESSGYSDPGRYDGAWENCYPAEYEDERIVTDVFLTTAGQKIRVADHVMLVVERDPLVQAEVAKVELEFPGPDYDAMYEAALERKRGWQQCTRKGGSDEGTGEVVRHRVRGPGARCAASDRRSGLRL